jgi:hypothetical protein
MHKPHGRNRVFTLLFGMAALVLTGWASADPPTRVARLGYISGAVSFSPAGEDDWLRATMNRPLITGDRLWVDSGARAELQVGSAVIRMSGSTSVMLLNLEDRVAQLQLGQGTLNVRVRRLGPQEVFEISTPNLAYSIRRPGEYRIDVDPAGDTTAVVVRSGQAEVYGDGAAYVVNAGQAYRFAGTGLRDYEYFQTPRADEFDRWSSERDRRGTVSARYVSRDVIGYEDLDEHGSWRFTEGYGNVWVPNRVAAGWAPYHDGHWAWVDPWGWTWVDDAPWGFAVSHYGRWANISGTWGWVPGPVRSRAVYAPALVAFVGGSNFQIGISIGTVAGIAWFPLGPRDVYRPSYPVSRNYFNNINTSNTTINTTNITNVYNNVNVRNITYVNQQVPGAIVAVPSTAFVQSQPVGRAAVRLSRETIAKAPVTAVAEVAPVQASVRGAATAGSRPPAEALKRPVVAKAPPPPAPIPFAAKQSALAANPGKPLDATALAAVKVAAPVLAPSVKVVSPMKPAGAPPRQQADVPMGQATEAQKAPQPSEAQKRAQRPEVKEPPQPAEVRKTPQPAVAVPRATEAQKAPQPPEAQKRAQRPEAKEAPQPAEVRKAPQPTVAAPRSTEAQKAPQPPEAQKRPQRPEMKEPPQPTEVRKAPQPTVAAPRATEAQKAPQPPEAQKRPQGPEVQEAPQPPSQARKATQPLVGVPRPPEAKASPPKPEVAKFADKSGENKSDARLKLEEKLRLEEKLKRAEEERNR